MIITASLNDGLARLLDNLDRRNAMRSESETMNGLYELRFMQRRRPTLGMGVAESQSSCEERVFA